MITVLSVELLLLINRQVYETGPRGPKYYIFGNRFTQNISNSKYSCNSWKKIFDDEFTRNCGFYSNLVRVAGDPSLKQNS